MKLRWIALSAILLCACHKRNIAHSSDTRATEHRIPAVFRVKHVGTAPEYQSEFEFYNAAQATNLPGVAPAINGRFRPTFVRYEAYLNGGWQDIPVYSDSLKRMYPLVGSNPYVFSIDLWPYAGLQAPIRCRLLINDNLYSEVFVLNLPDTSMARP